MVTRLRITLIHITACCGDMSDSSLQKIPGWLLLMGALSAIGPLAIDLYLPAFPFIAEGLSTSQGNVERTLAVYLFGLALAQLLYGPLADRYGRRKPILFGLVLFTVASVGCTLTDDIEHLTLWRFVQAFGGAAGMVIPRAVIRDKLETRDASKAMSLLILILGVMPILGPLFGGYLLPYTGWRGIFGLMALTGFGLLAASWLRMTESLPPENRNPLNIKAISRNYWGLVCDRHFIFYALSGSFGTAGLFTYISGAPRVLMDVYGIGTDFFGVLFGANAAALIFMSQYSARLLNRHSPDKLLARSQTVALVVTATGAVLTLLGLLNLTLFMICLLGFMACQGFVFPNSAAMALARQGHRLGVASALMGTLQMVFGTLAGLAISGWQSDSALPMTALLTVCAFLSWLFGRIAFSKA